MNKREQAAYNKILSELYAKKNLDAIQADNSIGKPQFYEGRYKALKEVIELLESNLGKYKS